MARKNDDLDLDNMSRAEMAEYLRGNVDPAKDATRREAAARPYDNREHAQQIGDSLLWIVQ